jgi:hypothetical protein
MADSTSAAAKSPFAAISTFDRRSTENSAALTRDVLDEFVEEVQPADADDGTPHEGTVHSVSFL